MQQESRKSVERRIRTALLDYIEILRGTIKTLDSELEKRTKEGNVVLQPVKVPDEKGEVTAISYPVMEGASTTQLDEENGYRFGCEVAMCGEPLVVHTQIASVLYRDAAARGYHETLKRMEADKNKDEPMLNDVSSLLQETQDRVVKKDTAP